jgi:hypothetical protein
LPWGPGSFFACFQNSNPAGDQDLATATAEPFLRSGRLIDDGFPAEGHLLWQQLHSWCVGRPPSEVELFSSTFACNFGSLAHNGLRSMGNRIKRAELFENQTRKSLSV